MLLVVTTMILAGGISFGQPVSATGQIPAGSAGSIAPSSGISHATSGRPKKMLDSALTPETRQALFDAMNAPHPSSQK
jgi:hypothetical protein